VIYRSKTQILHNLRNRWGRSFWQLPLAEKLRVRTSHEFCSHAGTCWYVGTRSSVSGDCVFHENPVLKDPFWYDDQFFRCTENVTLVGNDATPLLQDGRILLTSKRDQPKLFREEFPSKFEATRVSQTVDGIALSLVSRLDGVYYHWLSEQLPLVQLFRDYCISNKYTGTVLLRNKAPRFQEQSIRALWPDATIVTYSADARVGNLFVSTLPTAGFAAHPVVTKLRDELLKKYSSGNGPRRKLLYLYRNPKAWRTVENDTEVKDMLLSIGATIVDPGDLKFVDQIELFSNFHCIVSIFGSGLTNCLFASDADIVELAGDYNDVSFASLSTFAGNRQHRFYCQQSGENIIVNVDELRLFLARFLC
jgi:hypothetical protein